MQAEYRRRFYKKLGMFSFFDPALSVDSLGRLAGSELLPDIGVGLRYMMIPEERINIGVDVAVGKDDYGLYFRIGETYMRL
jgi:hypothetical protein